MSNPVIDSLGITGKRTKVHDSQMVLKMPSQVKALIGEFATREGVSESAVVRWALHEFFTKRGYNR